MHPTICKIGPLTVHSYGLMLAIAVITGTFLLIRSAKKKNISSEVIFDFVFVVVIGSLIGARIFYVILNLEYFLSYPLEIIMIQNGGLAVQGGLVGTCASVLWYIKKHKLPTLVVFDLIAPVIALGQSIGRIGCFLNGCCYGRPVSWGIYFPVHDAHLHPTQLYLMAGYLFIFIMLNWLSKKSYAEGSIFAFYLFMDGSLRFIIEFYRADHIRTVFGLSVFQYVSLFLILCSIVALFKLKRRAS